jgi:hypothetical protein
MENNVIHLNRLAEIIEKTIETMHTYHKFAMEAESSCEKRSHYEIIYNLYTNVIETHMEHVKNLYSPEKNVQMYKFFSALEEVFAQDDTDGR